MSDIAIRVEGLSKKYRIGSAQQAGYKTLRDSLTDMVTAPFQRVASLVRGEAYGAAEMDETIWALKDVSFEVQRGEVVGIIGRNGAGKSTLLKILSRITEPTEGRAVIHGRIGSLLEVGTGFHPELTGRENIYLNGAILGMTREEIERKFDAIVAFSGIEKFVNTPVKFYSSGMRVRLAFSVAAHLEPEILLVDEVLAVGDIAFQKKCLGKMESVASGGRTVFFVSHNMAMILSLCNRCILLRNGKVITIGHTEDVVQGYQESVDSVSRIPLRERKDRGGNGAIQIIEVSVQSKATDGSPRSYLRTGMDASFIIEYESHNDHPLHRVDFVLKFLDRYENDLFACNTRFQHASFSTLAPEGKVICQIPRFPLAPGEYRLGLWCAIRGVAADQISNAARFQVKTGDYFGTGQLPNTKKTGPFLVPHSWQTIPAD